MGRGRDEILILSRTAQKHSSNTARSSMDLLPRYDGKSDRDRGPPEDVDRDCDPIVPPVDFCDVCPQAF
jgi:hypothetical protein